MRLAPTLAITKSAAALSRLLGRGSGQALPGLLAERLDPRLARKLVAGLPNGVILVTGTNGKTTTTKLIASILAASGEKVLVNRTGSNLKRGITSALIAAAGINGRIDATVGLFEVDEASLRQVAADLNPRHIVVLNLFRDQLDRYGELDTTAALIGEGITATKANLYLNADDPLVASLAKYAAPGSTVNYFGIEGLPSGSATADKTAIDSDRCPICHRLLQYSRVFYGHIGHYRCSEGHFSRPRPGVVVTNVDSVGIEGSSLTISVAGKRHEVMFPLPGTYNMYNAIAVTSVLTGFGLPTELILSGLSIAEAAFGRVEKVTVRDRTLYLLLIKNPAGFSQVLETFLIGRREPHVLMAVNDLAADGRDVSWLWDVALELLAPANPHVITTGIRGTDMSLRLHYAGIGTDNVSSLQDALLRLVEETPAGELAFVLPTYTAMNDLRKVLSKYTQMQEV